jgi:flagellar motor switch protein FliN/FliY
MEESIASYFKHWIEEFARAVEMFTGERPVLSQTPANDAQLEDWEAKLAEFDWWQQETEDPAKFKVWVGAEEACWTAFGGSPGDGKDPRELFHEMLSQANQGSAAVLSASFDSPLRFGAGSANPPASLRPLRLAQISVKFRDAALPNLVVALEPAAAQILNGPKPLTSGKDGPAQISAPLSATALKPNPPMFDRLMELQLPLSVVLGQAVLPIRDVLKITSGSVIELNRRIGDYVEVVVHGTIVARGEIVSVKGNYGVRIKEVISRQDRFALQDAA